MWEWYQGKVALHLHAHPLEDQIWGWVPCERRVCRKDGLQQPSEAAREEVQRDGMKDFFQEICEYVLCMCNYVLLHLKFEHFNIVRMVWL